MIRKARSSDFNMILLLIRLNSSTFLSYEICTAWRDIEQLIEKQDRNNRYFVFDVSNKIVGCAGFSRQSDTKRVYSLNWFVVHPDFKRRGIGTELYMFIEGEIKKLRGRLIILNAGSGEGNQFFYEKMGFKQSGLIPRYYNNSKDLIWYYKPL